MSDFKREEKYLVLKWDDINKYLVDTDRKELDWIGDFIGIEREREGKKANTYVVVNQDEPYAETVWKLIELSQTSLSRENFIHFLEEINSKLKEWEKQ